MEQLSLFAKQPTDTVPVEVPEKHHWTLFVDGASRNNPGPAGAGIYLLKDSEKVHKKGFFLGSKTNNQAEYLALLIGLFLVKNEMAAHDTLRVVSDSQLLVRQIKGEYRVKNALLKPLHALASTWTKECDAHIVHVLRTENTHADAMANHGLDKKVPLPPAFVACLNNHEITL